MSGLETPKLVEYLKKEAEREREYARRLEETVSKSHNIMLKTLVKAVSLDSQKHALLYEALADILANPRLVTEEESEDILEEVERHIREEQESIEELEKLLGDPRVKDNPAARFIIEMMLRDEKFHHALLRRLYKAVVKPLVFSESDYWDSVWKDAVWHGAPGG